MKFISGLLILAAVSLAAHNAAGDTMEEYVGKAMEYRQAGDLQQAVAVMKKAIEEYPKSSTGHAYLGLFYGMMAGEATNFAEAGQMSSNSFSMLDKAVALDPQNPSAYLYRGLMGVRVPEFLGRLPGGIRDLEKVLSLSGSGAAKVSEGDIVMAYDLLGTGYIKSGEPEKARFAWEKVIALAPGSENAAGAAENIEKYCKSAQAEDPQLDKAGTSPKAAADGKKLDELLSGGIKAYEEADYDTAEKLLREALDIDSENASVNKYLGYTIGRQAEKGYDERIADDTDFRSGLVFESIGYLDKAVMLDPGDLELRFVRGSCCIEFPFFAGKLEQGIKDMNRILESEAPDSLKSQALFFLGRAYRKQGLSLWIKAASDYPDSRAAKLVYDSMKPDIKHTDLSLYKAPFVTIDFVLGFQDELPPQIGIWIEDEEGKYVNTVYVSGFSGYAEDAQIVLPEWAKSSEFRHSDAVTGASIDIGHHLYVWNLKDLSGKKVPKGSYTVKVEVSHWPTMKYQIGSAKIEIGKKAQTTVVEEGYILPYLEVEYFPKDVKGWK